MHAPSLLERAAERGVSFTPGPAFFADGSGEGALRLSFSALPVTQIEEGVARLADAIREFERQPGRSARERQLAVPLV
jgi:2-aminoadipate transaminase